MSNIKPLSYADPIDELRAIINKDFPDIDTSVFDVSLVKVSTGTGNTELLLVGDAAKGIAGSLKVNINRLDPKTLFNKFGQIQKNHTLRLTAMAGATVKLYDIIAHLNNLLGTKLTVSGNYPDVADQSIIVPAKGQKITINIGSVQSANGDIPVSLRIAPGKTFAIDVLNQGSGIVTSMVNRNMNPFVSTVGDLVWSLEKMPVASAVASTNLLLRSLDFTSIFGTLGKRVAAFDVASQGLLTQQGSSSYYTYKFTAVVRDKVNTILASAGIPPQTELRVARYAGHTIPQALNLAAYMDAARSCTRTSAFWGVTTLDASYAKRTLLPVAVNPEFSAVMKLYPMGINTAIYDGVASNDNKFWYLHFNEIS